MHVHRTRLNVGRGFPYALEQLRATLHAAAPVGQSKKQLVFGGRKIDELSIQRYSVCVLVDLHRANAEHVATLGGLHVRAAENVAYAKNELLRTEGLHEIVVRAEGQALHAIRLLASRGEH